MPQWHSNTMKDDCDTEHEIRCLCVCCYISISRFRYRSWRV